ncbi:MAG: hypothetical protein E7333_00525 [Clostridiales bacterium]|nr:hypothetical protein [Clostridiales bacterium]
MADIRYHAVDGYHGGTYGHMPLGSWRDILTCLKRCPDWKISLDIEPVSYDDLKLRDPAAYLELKEMLKDTSVNARLEIVAPTYAQPYPWITDGESLIRQLRFGHMKLAEHFPWIKPETYSVQEPCWTSAMPQVLKSFGYKRAVLKDPSTAFGGYHKGVDSELITWVGPDGTKIPAVPRYACEELWRTWQTESCVGDFKFTDKCHEHGIHHPAGMWYQDLGWYANPYPHTFNHERPGSEPTIPGDDIRHTTWREYMTEFAHLPAPEVRLSQEDLQVTLPWGEQEFSRMARDVRRCELAILDAEKADTLSKLWADRTNKTTLMDASVRLMLAQHHDAWICSPVGWAQQSIARVAGAQHTIKEDNTKALIAISDALYPDVTPSESEETVLAVNMTGRKDDAYVTIPVTLQPGYSSVGVYQNGKRLESQLIPSRFYGDGVKRPGLSAVGGPVCAGEVLVYAGMEGFGVMPLTLKSEEVAPETPAIATAQVEGDTAVMENDLYRVTFDLTRGGCITSMICKADGREVVDASNELPFNGYRGYWGDEERFASSTEHPATAKVLLDGPLMAVIRITGKVGTATYTQDLTLRAHDPLLHCKAHFLYPEDDETWFGDPVKIVEEHDFYNKRHRSYHDGSYKLNAYFPTTFAQKNLYKDAAFDVCQSQQEDTFFQGWDEIKHNNLISWVDVADETQGLTVMTDQTAGYVHGKETPLGLTISWGGDAGYWWGHKILRGHHEMCYDIMPHTGTWKDANVWHENEKRQHVPMVRRIGGVAENAANVIALRVTGGQVELSYVGLDDDDCMIARVFNPGDETTVTLQLPKDTEKAQMVELDGRVVCDLPVVSGAVTFEIPAFGLRTVRI